MEIVHAKDLYLENAAAVIIREECNLCAKQYEVVTNDHLFHLRLSADSVQQVA